MAKHLLEEGVGGVLLADDGHQRLDAALLARHALVLRVQSQRPQRACRRRDAPIECGNKAGAGAGPD